MAYHRAGSCCTWEERRPLEEGPARTPAAEPTCLAVEGDCNTAAAAAAVVAVAAMAG